MNEALTIVVSVLAAQQIRAAEAWWRVNRPKAPTAIQEDIDRPSSLIAIQTELGARPRNVGAAWCPVACTSPEAGTICTIEL